MTLDPNNPNTTATGIAANPNNWTQFANLLYIDAPATGFSYPLAYVDSTNHLVQPSIGIDPSRDAGIFLQVITRFLVRHPALLGNRVILVPESFGGVRATLMLYYLYNYASLAPPTIIAAPNAYYDSQVLGDLQQYFAHVFTNPNPTPAQIHSRFGHQIMIEPNVAGLLQNHFGTSDYLALNRPVCDATFSNEPCCLASNNPGKLCSASGSANEPNLPTCDPYNCDLSYNWSLYQEHTAAVNLNTIGTLTVALGVDPTTIAWMQANDRKFAYGRSNYGTCDDGTHRDLDAFSTQSMIDSFGKLQSVDGTDCYFIALNDQVNAGYPGAIPQWEFLGNMVGLDFLTNVQNNVATFITVAQLDQVIWSPSIADALSAFADPTDPNADPNIENLISSATYNEKGSNSGVSFSGSMTIRYKSSVPTGIVTMPAYLSGHSVPMRAPAALLRNGRDWYTAHL
jgi:hypothetical protein